MDLTMIVHIAGGAIALIAGLIALCMRKGSNKHKQAGFWFVGAMLVIATTGGIVAYIIGKPFDTLSSALAIYMVLTGWLTLRQNARHYAWFMFCGGILCIAGYLAVELYALQTGHRATDAPIGVGYVFALLLILALVGDIRYMRTGLDRRRQNRRHLWRLNFGLFMATASFFGARPHLFPEWMSEYGLLLILSFAPIMAIGYWRFRLRARAA